MFLEHFALNEQPFGVAPDPRFFYLGSKHRAALEALISGAQPNRRTLTLTAEPGMGKTSLLFHYLQRLRADSRTAFLFQTAGDSIDLLRYLLADLGLGARAQDQSAAHEILNRALSAQTQAGQRFILVIDDAHNLHENAFQSPGLLADFDKPWMKYVQIVMAGRPKLTECCAPSSMDTSREGISSCIRLAGFSPEETCAYICHRLRIAGRLKERLFTPDAQLLIAMQTRGIPRHINALCFSSMWIAYTMGAKQVNSTIVREAVADFVTDAENSEQMSRSKRSASQFIFAPFRSRTAGNLKAPNPRSPIWATASIFALLFVVIVAGAFWNTGMHFPRTGGQPTVGTTVVPAPTPSFAPAPVAMTIKPAIDSPFAAGVRPVMATSNDTPAPRVTPHTLAADQFVTVTVEPHVTLRHLSLQYLGRFDAETLAEISRLNPSLTDPNQIEVNAKIRLPLHLKRAGHDRMISVADAALIGARVEKP